jgi:acyl carrier protein
VETAVRRFLADELGKDVSEVGDADSLLESGILDSIAVMQLVAFLEKTYGIKVADEDLMPENFDTIAAVCAFVARGRAGYGD